MQMSIEDYQPVNTEFQSQLKSQLAQILHKLDTLNSNPQRQINDILSEEFRRIKARTWNSRKSQHNSIQTLEAKKKIRSLKREVVSLKNNQSSKQTRRQTKGIMREYETLKKQLQMKTELYKQQLRRQQIQVRQIQALKTASLSLLEKFDSDHSEEQLGYENEKHRQGIEQRLKQLQIKKIQAIQMKSMLKQKYQQALKQRIGKMVSIQQASMQRELLQIKIDKDIDIQRQILGSAQIQPQTSQREIGRIYRPRKSCRRQQFNDNQLHLPSTPQLIHQSVSSYKLKIKPPSKRLRTLSIDKSDSRSNNQIKRFQKIRCVHPPINLTPSKYSLRYNENQKYTPIPKRDFTKQLDEFNTSSSNKLFTCLNNSQSKPNSLSNFDTSISSSMYKKNRQIQLVKESIVQLSPIHEEGRKFCAQKQWLTKSHNQNKSRRLTLKRDKFSKASISETTKEESRQIERQITVPKGIPFECEPMSDSGNSQSGYHTNNRVQSRQIKIPTYNIQQF